MVETDDDSVEIRMVLVPIEELEIIEDWDTIGLRGTGSHTTTATDVLIPEHRTIDLNAALTGTGRSEANRNRPLYHTGFFAHVQAISAGVPVGIAHGAMDHFLERIPGRGITYTPWKNQAEAPITQHEVAEAQLRIEAAEMMAAHVAETVYKAAAGEGDFGTRVRADARARVSYTTEVARQAVAILRRNSGASAIQRKVPIQRSFRDIESLATHAALAHNSSREVYGRVLLDLDPGTPFL